MKNKKTKIIKLLILTFIITSALTVNYLFAAWSGPTATAPGGNTPTPIHVGTTNQVKNGGLSLTGLSVLGSAYIRDYLSIGNTNVDGTFKDGGRIGNVGSGSGERLFLHTFYNSIDNGGIDILKSNGNVGIGTTNPQARLQVGAGVHISDANWAYLAPDIHYNSDGSLVSDKTLFLIFDGEKLGGNNSLRIGRNSITTNPADGYLEVMRVTSGGRVGIGTIAPDERLTVNGNASKLTGGTSWLVFSDERLKDIHSTFNLGLDAILKIQPIRYSYKKDNSLKLLSDKEYVGLSAQEVQRVIPDAVSESENGYLKLESDPILWAMLNAIKEQQKQIESLKSENASLKSDIDQIKSTLGL